MRAHLATPSRPAAARPAVCSSSTAPRLPPVPHGRPLPRRLAPTPGGTPRSHMRRAPPPAHAEPVSLPAGAVVEKLEVDYGGRKV